VNLFLRTISRVKSFRGGRSFVPQIRRNIYAFGHCSSERGESLSPGPGKSKSRVEVKVEVKVDGKDKGAWATFRAMATPWLGVGSGT